MARIFLSPPDVGDLERRYVDAAMRSGWVAPAGPDLDAFELAVAQRVDMPHAVGLSSGTAALHLALLAAGVAAGDTVLTSTFTFAASANPVVYLGATPAFVDSDAETWNLSPGLLEEELAARARAGTLPRAVVVVDLYGQCADYDRLRPLCEQHGVALIEDAAEALGATYGARPAGSLADLAVLSFNGNKVITTSGGGMLLARDSAAADRARYLATQARQPAAHYEHTEIGFNYRLSNIAAAIGRAQLEGLDAKIARRQVINERYRAGLASVDGLDFMPVAAYGTPNFWLTCVTIEPATAGFDREQLRLHLEAHDIESRPTWKPMHLQPVFRDAPRRVDGTSERIFDTGLCLPSGSSLSAADQDRVIGLVLELAGR